MKTSGNNHTKFNKFGQVAICRHWAIYVMTLAE